MILNKDQFMIFNMDDAWSRRYQKINNTTVECGANHIVFNWLLYYLSQVIHVPFCVHAKVFVLC